MQLEVLKSTQREGTIRNGRQVLLQLKGKTGNQLFQYAAGKYLSQQIDAELLVYQDAKDVGTIPNTLLHFKTQARLASQQDLRRCFWPASKPRGQKHRLCREFLAGYAQRFIEDELPTSLALPQPMTRPLHLSGFFQNFEAADALGASLRQDLILKTEMAPQRRHILHQIRSGPSAALHIRRGDYLEPAHQEAFGSCDLSYYTQAITLLRNTYGVNTFYLFSDDPEWARAHLGGKRYIQIVAPLGDHRDHEDILLIAACDHAVIANSSFSWWGAYLNRSPRKVVIAPKIWFRDGSIDEDRLLPPTWLRL
ncbi:alpha-1,2-fucosyltransferase [Pseudovibrio sp. SPO723]|uniref:alpha-1,2-fucosyltransferase n=1 Tax=Nesiotobacter zosterae TaxID=392721 RepID=UPI0029C531DF|nr:alpha-1,2-fucosyltransferase [Pseudovibrio sp. SPO723]MDX5593038.1 alpha-1,2-fucosyltransferase [Pseudovibrio sp. SPO723]